MGTTKRLQLLWWTVVGLTVTGLAAGPAAAKKRRSIDALIAILQYAEDDDDREDAAEELGKLGDPRALAALEYAAVYDEEDDVREEAREAIKRIRKHWSGSACEPVAPVATEPVDAWPYVGSAAIAEPIVIREPVAPATHTTVIVERYVAGPGIVRCPPPPVVRRRVVHEHREVCIRRHVRVIRPVSERVVSLGIGMRLSEPARPCSRGVRIVGGRRTLAQRRVVAPAVRSVHRTIRAVRVPRVRCATGLGKALSVTRAHKVQRAVGRSGARLLRR